MRKPMTALAAVFVFTACDGNPFATTTGSQTADQSPGSVNLSTQGTFLTLNNASYDASSDTLFLNNIPFDDPNNAYARITTEAFANGYDAYESAPAAGTNQVQYYAIFRRSDSGHTQVAAAGTTAYVSFGYGGAIAQRLTSQPTLPTNGIYSYNGEYGAVRTTLGTGGAAHTIQYVIGDATLRLDFDDFDDTGAIGGTVQNRRLYDTTGALIGTLDGFISLQDTTIDTATATVNVANATEFAGTGAATGNTGRWEGVLAGPGGVEIAGILFVEGTSVREAGTFVTTR